MYRGTDIQLRWRTDVTVYATRAAMGVAAGTRAEELLRTVLENREEARVVFAAAPSQDETLAYLVNHASIDWGRVTAFHMDEYIGLPSDASQGFGRFLDERIFTKLPFRAVHHLNGNNDIDAEVKRYGALLSEKPVDVLVMGVGENGHIAFNDPPVADFRDPMVVKAVDLDSVCRKQQVHDGCFSTLEAVPKRALTLTVPTLMAARHAVCVVPGSTKARAVRDMLIGPIGTACPASILRTHPDCSIFLDTDSGRKIL